jgi:drug/metabolite transporter (DMT)-like permease
MHPSTILSPSPVPSATVDERRCDTRGMLLGLAGVALFSLTLPFTRIAVAELDPLFVALARAVGAAVLAGAWLRWKKIAPPPRAALPALAMVALGCIVGFPLLTSIAMRSLPASHGAVLVGALPLCTALYSALRGHERPSPGFWALALLGSGLVVAFALSQGDGHFAPADYLMFAAVLSAAAGYAEGGRLARSLGGQETISWALVLAAPPSALLLAVFDPGQFGRLAGVGLRAWLALGYITVFSTIVGFFFWYRGLALGGVARVGQVQLVQPFLSLGGAWVLLGEPLTVAKAGFALAVIGVVAAGRRMQVRR